VAAADVPRMGRRRHASYGKGNALEAQGRHGFMRLGSLFVLFGLLFGWWALRLPGPGCILGWAGVSFLLVGWAYLAREPCVFGKRPDGTMAVRSVVLLLPYLLCVWAVWRLRRLIRRGEPYQELAPGIIIGRRLFPSEYPATVEAVLDLTCEFPEFQGVRRARHYRSFPILDGHVPKSSDLTALVGRLGDLRGTWYVHCAEGYGRAGLVGAAILLARGLATEPDEAIRMVQARRPGVRLTKRQREMLAEVAKALTREAGTSANEKSRP